MSHKIFPLLLSGLLIATNFTPIYSSAETNVVINSDISPCYLYTNHCDCNLSIKNSTATCYSSVNGYNGITTKIVITQYLYIKNDHYNTWGQVDSWSATFNTYYSSLSNYAYNLSSGTYRLKTVAKVYSGNNYETIEYYSFDKTI